MKYEVYVKEYNIFSKEYNNVLRGVALESGLTIPSNPMFQRCFFTPLGYENKEGNQITCKCIAYDGFDNNALANLIATKVAEKISVKLNEENSKNIEKTVMSTFEMHGDLVKSLQTFVNDLMELKESK